jgi:glutamate/tyrosine decarboxylase-like PLP-dependent enzyme
MAPSIHLSPPGLPRSPTHHTPTRPPPPPGAMHVVGQLYQLVRLGFDGYRAVCAHMLSNTRMLEDGIRKLGVFEIISSHKGIPLVTFHLKDDPDRSYDEFAVAERLRLAGWVVPAYALAKDNEARKVRAAHAAGGKGLCLVHSLLSSQRETATQLADIQPVAAQQLLPQHAPPTLHLTGAARRLPLGPRRHDGG